MSIFSSNKDNKEVKPEQASVPASSRPSYSEPGNYSSPALTSSATTISSGTVIDGNVKTEGNIIVEGVVKGTITAKGLINVGATGKIDGDMLCKEAQISGSVEGKIKVTDVLQLKSNALVNGDIITGKLVIESGVKFNGNCTMGSMASVPAGGSSAKSPMTTEVKPATAESAAAPSGNA